MPRRILQGTVISAKNSKTVSIRVERKFRHILYKKIVKKSAKYVAHDARDDCKLGDKIRIKECRPISKTKSWIVIE